MEREPRGDHDEHVVLQPLLRRTKRHRCKIENSQRLARQQRHTNARTNKQRSNVNASACLGLLKQCFYHLSGLRCSENGTTCLILSICEQMLVDPDADRTGVWDLILETADLWVDHVWSCLHYTSYDPLTSQVSHDQTVILVFPFSPVIYLEFCFLFIWTGYSRHHLRPPMEIFLVKCVSVFIRGQQFSLT